MNTLTIKSLGVSITSNEGGMFNLNDLHKQAGLSENKRPSQWRSTIRSAMERTANLQSARVKTDKNGHDALFGTEQGVYAYAMWISPEFYLAVVNAFKELASGNNQKATDIALSSVISQDMLDKEKALRVEMNTLIKEKLGGGHAYVNYSRLACKCISGYTPSELKGSEDSAFKYIVEQKHGEGAGAYLASLEAIIMGLRLGLDYHQIAAMLRVKTGKNKEVFS